MSLFNLLSFGLQTNTLFFLNVIDNTSKSASLPYKQYDVSSGSFKFLI